MVGCKVELEKYPAFLPKTANNRQICEMTVSEVWVTEERGSQET
jgi:hypothetical protein